MAAQHCSLPKCLSWCTPHPSGRPEDSWPQLTVPHSSLLLSLCLASAPNPLKNTLHGLWGCDTLVITTSAKFAFQGQCQKVFLLSLEPSHPLPDLDLAWLCQHHLSPLLCPVSGQPPPVSMPWGCWLFLFGDELIVDFNSLRCFPGKHAGRRPTLLLEEDSQARAKTGSQRQWNRQMLPILWIGLAQPEGIPNSQSTAMVLMRLEREPLETIPLRAQNSA